LVTFGTPFRGSGNAVDFLSNGFKWTVGRFSAFDGSEAPRSFNSIYQLLPIYPFVNDGSSLVRPAEVAIPNVDRDRAQAALSFHIEMTDGHSQNKLINQYGRDGPKVRPVIGIDQPTTQSALLTPTGLEALQTHDGQAFSGDGTVSRVSALLLDGDESSATYVAATHSAMQSLQNSHDHLRGVLTAGPIDFDKFRTGLPMRASISLELPDAFDGSTPIPTPVAANGSVQAFFGLVERIDLEGQAWRPTLLRAGANQFAAPMRLPLGLYRFSVSDPNFQPASDIFLVADATIA